MNREKIRQIRNDLGLTQAEFAKLIGVHRITVVYWEGGKMRPSRLAMQAIERALHSRSKVVK